MKYECIDKTTGNLLHGYELGILSESEQERFELHLLTCNHCFEELRKSSEISNLMINDSEVVKRINSFATKHPIDSKKKWKERPYPFKWIGLAALVFVIIIPMIMYTSFHRKTESTVVQKIELYPNRSIDSSFSVDKTTDIEIQFVFEDSDPDQTYLIRLFDEQGKIVYTNDHFSGFELSDFASITLSPSILKEGRYKLVITDPNGDQWTNSQEYRFTLQYK